ncbi:DtxR family transcriptional regulator [Candidatus Aerophobetes bacterium]|uniref:DtxR family transcriptional regulator n=1 Tax=Aerophobetes bacterium TaxID=2030807 RepID=A0A662DAU3_UNCAE|nr:MAG: DtxR family transcriptional regulator [Candidatus Aerophobetes bacterium]
MNTLTESAQDYLEAILVISQEKKVVRVKDIARYLKVKMPSVVAMIRNLAEKNLVRHEHYGYVELTEKGLREAKFIYERHKMLFNFFHNLLGIDATIAKEDACKIEHYLNPKTLEYILKFIQFVETCPEGEPLWLSSFYYFVKHGTRPEHCGKREKIEERVKMSSSTLNNLKVGQKGKVLKISAESGIKRRLLDMGIVPGVKIKVEKIAPLGDPMDILVKGYHLTLRKEEASCITVEVMK